MILQVNILFLYIVFLYMILKPLAHSTDQMTVIVWKKMAPLCYNFHSALIRNWWWIILPHFQRCLFSEGTWHVVEDILYIWRCSCEYCLQEDAFRTFMVERRLSMFCVCISFLNDPHSCLGSLLALSSGLHASHTELEADRVPGKHKCFCSSKVTCILLGLTECEYEI